MQANRDAKFASLSTNAKKTRFSLFRGQIAKTGATRETNVTVLKKFALPFALYLTFALVCFDNDKIVGLIIRNVEHFTELGKQLLSCRLAKRTVLHFRMFGCGHSFSVYI